MIKINQHVFVHIMNPPQISTDYPNVPDAALRDQITDLTKGVFESNTTITPDGKTITVLKTENQLALISLGQSELQKRFNERAAKVSYRATLISVGVTMVTAVVAMLVSVYLNQQNQKLDDILIEKEISAIKNANDNNQKSLDRINEQLWLLRQQAKIL